MNRLAEKDDLGNWSLKGVKWEHLYKGAIITEELHDELRKLMEYEDAGRGRVVEKRTESREF